MERPPILNECHLCGEPHTLPRMVHKWDYSYCLPCYATAQHNYDTTTEGTEQ
jgi:formylmethanofuran dehydrogenase subunit E